MVRLYSWRSPQLQKLDRNRLSYDITTIIQSNNNASELETEYVLIQFPHSFNNTKPVVLFTLHQSQSLEGIFLLERLPRCDTWAM